MSKPREKQHAILLRRKGNSIKNIAKKLSVSPASVSAWCRDIELSKKQKDVIKENAIKRGHRGRLIGAEINKQKKVDRINEATHVAIKKIGSLSQRDLLILGLGLYWGEGTKGDDTRVAIVNSDPNIIKAASQWYIHSLGVSKDDFRPMIYINNTHKKRSDTVLRYWSKELGIPKKQFGNTVFLKRKNKKVYENHDSYYGILAFRIAMPAKYKYLIMGMIDAINVDIKSRGSSVG